MILRRHFPSQPLSQFVAFFWYYQDWDGSHSLEHVLPDGTFELVINLLDGPRKLFDRSDLTRYTPFHRGWLSGAHSQYIVIDAMPGASMIGAHFKPGGIAPFLRQSAGEFQDQVIEVDGIWGGRARRLRQILAERPSPEAKFQSLEQFLLDLLKGSRIDQQRQARIVWATNQLRRQPPGSTVGAVVRSLGVSHKHFIDQFRDQVGLSPKIFSRICRFREVLTEINRRRQFNWADVACACGYFDQAHFANDFQAFAGLKPSHYRSLDEEFATFVPIDGRR